MISYNGFYYYKYLTSIQQLGQFSSQFWIDVAKRGIKANCLIKKRLELSSQPLYILQLK